MVRFKIAIVPALLAVALYGAGMTYADPGKNGDAGGSTDGGKNGGGDGGGKNGGGDGGGKNGGGKNGGGGGGNGGGKGGEPPSPGPGPGPGPGPRPTHGDISGPGIGPGKKQIVCVINGEIFRVRRISDCASAQVEYRPVVRRKARRVVRQVYQGGCGCNYGGGQDVVIGGGGGFVGSPAAVRQARRRANAYGYYSGGYSAGYSGGYSSGYGYGEAQVVVRKKRIKRKRNVVYYDPSYGYGYEPGVVLHTGPAVMKDGGY